ncbi:MAG: flavodoxin family protein [Chitinivibrionales bacterium]|nr:flavodoxin family protein [Chitinivibrionales bacterium]
MPTTPILVFKGSPRKNGNTAALADQVIAGARSKGAEVEELYLHGMDIAPCRACNACQKSTATDCAIKDDMVALYPKLRAARALVYASPVYWFTVSAQIKLLMDRSYALCGPEGFAFRGKKVGIVMSYADSDCFASGAVNAFRMFQDGFRLVGAQIVDIVHASADAPGEVAGNSVVMAKARELGERLAG